MSILIQVAELNSIFKYNLFNISFKSLQFKGIYFALTRVASWIASDGDSLQQSPKIHCLCDMFIFAVILGVVLCLTWQCT